MRSIALLLLAVSAAGDDSERPWSIPTADVATSVQCGSAMTFNFTSSSDEAHFLFCPDSDYFVDISTCGSSGDTVVRISGPDYQNNIFDDHGDHMCASSWNEKFTALGLHAGNCYFVSVRPYASKDWDAGEYKLALTCENSNSLHCGSSIHGSSTAALNEAVDHYEFCSDGDYLIDLAAPCSVGKGGRIEVELSGPGQRHMQDFALDCSAGTLQQHRLFGIQSGHCYHFGIKAYPSADALEAAGGVVTAPEDYELILSCSRSVVAPIQKDDCSMYLFFVPGVVGLEPEGKAFLRAINSFSRGVILVDKLVTDIPSYFSAGAQIVIPDLDVDFVALNGGVGSPAMQAMWSKVHTDGAHILLTVHNYELDFVNALTGWALQSSGSCNTDDPFPRLEDAGGFENGPVELPQNRSGSIRCVNLTSLPQTVDGLYASTEEGEAMAFTAPFGNGRITILGSDFDRVSRPWYELLEFSLRSECKRHAPGVVATQVARTGVDAEDTPCTRKCRLRAPGGIPQLHRVEGTFREALHKHEACRSFACCCFLPPADMNAQRGVCLCGADQ